MLSVLAGGAGTVLVVIAVAWIWPEIRRLGALGDAEQEAPPLR